MLPALTLAAALTLAPAQADKITLSNVRATHGLIGPARATAKFLPGDTLYLNFDIAGVSVAKDGKAVYTMSLEVLDKDKKPKHKVDPTERVDFVPLGGPTMPGVAFVVVGVDLTPGEYTVKLSVSDGGVKDANKPSGSFTFPFEVLNPDLGIVNVYASSDPQGANPTHTSGFVGQSIFVQFAATGFKRDPAKKNQPDLKLEMWTTDEKGTATLATPLTKEATALEEKYPSVSAWINVPLTRPGKFKVVLKVTDNVAGKSASFELPVEVLPTNGK